MESDRDSGVVSGTDPERGNIIPKRTAPPPNPTAPKNFLRPTTQRAARRRAPPHSKDRFEAEVLGGKLWHHACQEISRDDFNGEIPMEFPSIDEYIATLDPLVLEEAREGLKTDWAENCTAGRTWRVEILSVDERAEGWAHVRMKIHGGREQEALQACGSNNTAVVLAMGRPPQKSAMDWINGITNSKSNNNTFTRDNTGKREEQRSTVDGGEEGTGPASRPVKRSRIDHLKKMDSREGTPLLIESTIDSEMANTTTVGGEAAETADGDDVNAITSSSAAAKVVAGLTIRGGGGGGYRGNTNYNNSNRGGGGGGGGGQEVTLKIHPCCCPAHASSDGSTCTGILEALRKFPSAWWMAPAGMLVTSEREFDAVHAVRSVDSELMKHILKPKLLADIGKYYENDVGFLENSFKKVFHLLRKILNLLISMAGFLIFLIFFLCRI